MCCGLLSCKKYNDEDVGVIERGLLKGMNIQCIGRYSIGFPDTFVVGESPEAEFYYGLGADFEKVNAVIVDRNSSRERFESRVAGRVAAISASMNEASGSSMLVMDKEIRSGERLIRYFDNKLSDQYHKHEVHLRLNNVHVMLSADSYKGVIQPVEARLLDIAERITLRGDGEQRTEKGFCLGPLVIDTDSDHEVLVKEQLVDQKHPDVKFDFFMSAVTPDEDESLSAQITRESAVLSSKPDMLKKGSIGIGGMNGEQVLMRFDEDGLIMHSFRARSLRKDPSLTRPSISISLETGGDVSSRSSHDLLAYGEDGALPDGDSPRTVSSSLSDEEAIALWDAVIRSIRPRRSETSN